MMWFYFFKFKINFITFFKFSFFEGVEIPGIHNFFSSSGIASDFTSTNRPSLKKTAKILFQVLLQRHSKLELFGTT